LSIGISLLNNVLLNILGTGDFVTLVLALASALGLTPFLIAVHRFVILGEIVHDYRSIWFTPRFRTFFTLLAAVTTATSAPSLLLRPLADVIGAGILVAAPLGVLLAVLWLSLIFPAAAVDAPGLSLSNAAKDLNGNVLRLFCVDLVSMLPLVLLAIMLDLMLPKGFASALIGSVLSPAFVALPVVIASRFYLWTGDRLKQTP
jgi:hypothetical protein